MKQVAIAIDQLVNAILGGWADETISARVYRNRNNSWWWKFWHKVIDTIFFFDKQHCETSYRAEIFRLQLSEYYQKYKQE